jgi:hypothetical protein
MSSQLRADPLALLAELSCALDEYVDWLATPGDDECPPATVERLLKAHQEARDLVSGYGKVHS